MSMTGDLQKRERFDYFTIWGNGLLYADEILNILRSQKNLRILRIESLKVRNMNRFVFDLYACDTVPLSHLKSKLRYLDDVVPEVIVVYAKNLDPEELPVGEGEFRNVQCQFINRLKWEIRDKFNPRSDGLRTEEHVIHASDYEEQVDYFLKMTGHAEGIEFLEGGSEGLPFYKPYHIKRPGTYIFMRIPVDLLRASILMGDPGGKNYEDIDTSVLPIAKTPHYLGLCGEDAYEGYISKYKYKFLMDDHTVEKLVEMRELTIDNIRVFSPILIVSDEEHYRILDGVHRAATALFHNVEKINCVECVYQ